LPSASLQESKSEGLRKVSKAIRRTPVSFQFKVQHTDAATGARAGEFSTGHGIVQTPVFMPVGTLATVKTLSSAELEAMGSQIILGNTYHLLLRPGPEVFQKFGGIHKFMNWTKPVLTDSGGFQIFSLPKSRKITEEGAVFQSYVQGLEYKLSPESSIAMQNAIGSDIMMVLDQCISSKADFEETKKAMELTHRWAVRSLKAHTTPETQALFGIVQGGVFENLRKESADFLTQLPFNGFAIGGLAVGETKAEREDFTELVTGFLPKDKPRYLMGVGTPTDLLEAVKRGVDMFDCIIPSKMAQQGNVYTSLGELKLCQSQYKFSDDKIDPHCGCTTCKTYSRGYMHHLSKCRETLGWRALAVHNISYFHNLMKAARQAIFQNNFEGFYKEVIGRWEEDSLTAETSRDPGEFPSVKKKDRGEFQEKAES
jgi:queuine tRNA-ribosyltransferase